MSFAPVLNRGVAITCMADIRQSPNSNSPESKVIFDAESVAGDLWLRQHYHGIHLELDARQAREFANSAEGAGLILENLPRAGSSSDTDLAH
jgi:hypothetical protein